MPCNLEAGKDLEVFAYLTKPINPFELLELINKALGIKQSNM